MIIKPNPNPRIKLNLHLRCQKNGWVILDENKRQTSVYRLGGDKIFKSLCVFDSRQEDIAWIELFGHHLLLAQ